MWRQIFTAPLPKRHSDRWWISRELNDGEEKKGDDGVRAMDAADMVLAPRGMTVGAEKYVFYIGR